MDSMNIGLSKEAHAESIKMLEKLLADEYVLYTKTLNFHWNIKSPHFSELHGLLEKQYEQLQGFVDEVAERIRILGGMAPGTLAEFSKLARLKEESGIVPTDKEMLKKLLEDHESIIRSLREALEISANNNDAGTNAFLGEFITQHEKTAWMLRSSL